MVGDSSETDRHPWQLAGPGSKNGLAYDPNTNTLYGSDAGDSFIPLAASLITIDTGSAAGTPVATFDYGRLLELAWKN